MITPSAVAVAAGLDSMMTKLLLGVLDKSIPASHPLEGSCHDLIHALYGHIEKLMNRAALTQEQPEKPCVAHKENFETLKRAFAAGNVALMEVEVVATGERLAALCAVEQRADGEIDMVPFAVMLNGNPYQLLNPPKPEGGFMKQGEAWK